MSVRPDFLGDYMGFTYNGVHSSTLGIVRVSDGSRFNENLLPTIQDKTVQVPGGDGTYYFGSYFTQRQISVSYAFDSLTEDQIARLRAHFGDKQIHDLVFDETPYKVYSAKVTGTATLKYIPFDGAYNTRIYKGEGTIQFTCYSPFARCYETSKDKYKNLILYDGLSDEEKNQRIEEWWDASRIGQGGNFGDVPVPFRLIMSPGNGPTEFGCGNDRVDWSKLTQKAVLDTKTGLVVALDGEDKPTNTVLSRYVTGNLTMKIPTNSSLKNSEKQTIQELQNSNRLSFNCLYI